jgi:NAD(P)-dependent dehydrogenase (short-subunit alcohol dehydrogenase family)
MPHRFTQVFWLDATNRSTIEQSYKDIGAQIRGASDERIEVDAARASLASLREEWLLLVDGADDVDAMSGLWPPCRHGNILYTSRNPVLKEMSPESVCEVAELEKDEAVELLLDAARLRRHASEEVMRLAEDIVSELGWLALAVNQAGALMALGECRIRDFLVTFKTRRAQLFSVNAYKDASTYEQAVYATWELSYSAIQRKASKRARQTPEAQAAWTAIQLLNMLAFFHYENVMEDIFRRAAEYKRRYLRYPSDIDPSGELAHGVNLPEEILPLDRHGNWDARQYHPFRC